MPAASTPPVAVLFDLDGTLLDSIELILQSARYAFAKLERDWLGDDAWLAGIGIPLFTMFARFARDEPERLALLAAYREFQYANHDRLIRCYDDVVDTVHALRRRGHPVAIVTSKSEYLALRGLTLVGLGRHVDTIVGCDGCTRHKPDPEPVRIALHRLGASPDRAVFLGDSVHDVVAGNSAGVRTAAALWGAFRREDLEPGNPGCYLERMRELLPLVESLGV